MKNIFFFLFPVIIVLFSACQAEEYEVITDEDQNTISLNSEVYDLIYRTAMYDGSVDDVIDGSPCSSIEVPFSLLVDGEEVNISSEAERSAFLESLPPNVRPEDIEVVFPVNIKNSGHQTVRVVNIQQYRGIQQGCRNSIARNGAPITCARFTFPVQLTSYNPASQQTGSAVLNSQEEFFQYLDNIQPGTVLSLDFPLQVLINDMEIAIPNQNRLREILRDCEG